MASPALIKANKAAQAQDYALALSTLDNEVPDHEKVAPPALMIRLVCLWKGSHDFDGALQTYEAIKAHPDATPPTKASAARNAAAIKIESKVAQVTAARNLAAAATTPAAKIAAAAAFEAVDLDDPSARPSGRARVGALRDGP